MNYPCDKLCLISNTRGSFKSEESLLKELSQTLVSLTTHNPQMGGNGSGPQFKEFDFELSSFIWQLDSKVLDYVLLRFKMETIDK